MKATSLGITQLFLCILLHANITLGVETIDITRGNIKAIPIALNEFATTDPGERRISNKMLQVISNNLRNSSLFRPISRAAFIENKIGVDHTPLFAAWQQINASLLLNGTIESGSWGKLKVKFTLWDNYIEKAMISESFELKESSWRRLAHKISDVIYEQATGYKGHFDTKIVYIAESGTYLNRIKRIAIMDQDGANHRYLTDGSKLVLTPRFSPDSKQILYLSYEGNSPTVYQMDIKSGRRRSIGNFPGMSFAPHFSPDGKFAVFSIAKNGDTHIYEINLKNKKTKQLTSGSSINTSPNFSPDGKRIVFNSDRYGSRQLFVMNRDGSNMKRISYSGGSYSEPAWSAGNHIAFTKTSRDHGFTIGVMRPSSSPDRVSERLLARGYLVESPSWSPNGRMLIFTKGIRPKKNNSKGLHRIYKIDLAGINERLVPTPNDASDPDWSMPKG